MRSAARKDDPFISEFDMGLTDHLVEKLNDLDMLEEQDYALQKRDIAHNNRKPSELLLVELKQRLEAYIGFRAVRGMSREEMEFKLAYHDRAATKTLRLREAADVAAFGHGETRLAKIVGDTEANKGVKFRREPFKLARPVFLRLPEMEQAFVASEIPALVLDRCLCAFDVKREWVFCSPPDTKRGLPRFKFGVEFLEALRSMEETARVFWFRDKNTSSSDSDSSQGRIRSYAALSEFIQMHDDPATGQPYKKLEFAEYWWKSKHGDDENPVRFTESGLKVLSNFKSGSFEPSSVAELLYQSDRRLEPVPGEWDTHGRRKYDFDLKLRQVREKLSAKYKSRPKHDIERMARAEVKPEHFFHLSYARLANKPVGIPIQRMRQKTEAELDAEEEEQERREKEARRAARR